MANSSALSGGDAVLRSQGGSKVQWSPARLWNAEPTIQTASRSDRRQIVDTLNAGRSHRRPGGIERARQIDGPAAGLDNHGLEAKPARVHRGVVNAKVGREPGEEDSLETALAQITRKARGSAPIVLMERGVGIDFRAKPLADHDLRPLPRQLRMKGRARRTLHTMIGPKRLLAIGHADGFKRR